MDPQCYELAMDSTKGKKRKSTVNPVLKGSMKPGDTANDRTYLRFLICMYV